MDYEAKVRWLSPDRVMKVYKGKKASYGSRRLFVIGIGGNGIDILIKCKDITENRYGLDNSRIMFLGIGLKEQLDNARCNGSVLEEGERLEINPDEAIYPYLNDPEKLPAEAADWFDEGLRNYTPNKPVYGLSKRQCARLTLFHCFDALKERLGTAVKNFLNDKSTIEIVLTGNLGDAFFGGMVIDLAYITKAFFAPDKCPITVTASMLAADTAKLQGLDGRDLAIFYANTVVTKCELDKFQCQKKEYSQTFCRAYTFSSNKAPFSSCFINAAEESYDLTVENAALKILTDSALLFKQDDDADRLLSHNMLGSATQHNFRYLCSGTAVDEIPMGKIVSYLTVKTVMALNNILIKKSAGDGTLNMIASKVTPDELLLALKAGDIPKIEYDESLNPLFSIKSLKNGAHASKNYVNERLNNIAMLCRTGAEVYLEKVYEEVVGVCEKAYCDNEQGPYYASEIAKRCINTLKKAIVKKKEQIENADMDVPRDEHQLMAEWRSIHGTFGLFGNKDAGAYISRMKKYAEGRQIQLMGGIVLEFYEKLLARLQEFYDDKMAGTYALFAETVSYFNSIEDKLRPSESGFVRDAFDVSDKRVREKLDRLMGQLSQEFIEEAFKKSKMLEGALSDDPKMFAAEACAVSCICFRELFSSSYDELCQAFGTNRTVARALEDCIERVHAATPASDEQPLVRAVCPQNAQMEDIAGLRAVHNNLNSVWTNSSLLHTVIVQQVVGGVRIDRFKDYEQWENMRYAYVNDSLKKHGIHIFA